MSEIATDDEDERLTKPSVTALDDDAVEKRNKLLIEIWKQAVDTQKHFNDMCVKSRQLGLTFVAASLGAALYLFIRSTPAGPDAETAASRAISAYSFSVCGHSIILHVSLAIIIAAAAAVYAVRRLDLGVYHQMLRGAVTFGEDLEEKHIRHIVGLQKGMTQAISHFSRHSDAATNHFRNRRTGMTDRIPGNQFESAKQLLLETPLYETLVGMTALRPWRQQRGEPGPDGGCHGSWHSGSRRVRRP